MSQNIIFAGLPNLWDGATLTAGSEAATLPVENTQDRQIRKPWRTTSVDADDTYIVADFGSAQLVGVVALVNHNLGIQAKLRIRLSNNADFSSTVYDSGLFDALPEIEPFGTFEWGVFTWGGKLPQSVIDAITVNTFHVIPSNTLARYLRIDIQDESNGDGYIEVGRMVAGVKIQPAANMSWGWEVAFEDPSKVSKSRGGQTYVDDQEQYRVIRFGISNMTENEAFSFFFDLIDRRKGVTGDLVVIPQPDKPSQFHNQAFYGRMRSLGAVRNPFYDQFEKAFEIEELL